MLLIYKFADIILKTTWCNFKLMKMDHSPNDKTKLFQNISDHLQSFFPVLKSRYFYFGILAVIAGIGLNIASQAYLHNYISEGKTLPMLSDLILDNLPVINVSLIYDIFALFR